MQYIRLVSVVWVLLFAFSEASEVAPRKVSLLLKWKNQFQSAGFLIAKEKGFYRDVGIEVDISEYENGTDIVQDVLDNKVSFGVSDSDVILGYMRGKPIVALMALFQHSPNVLMALESSGIRTIEDLKDKKIAIYSKDTAISIFSMLRANKIDYHRLDVVFDVNKLIDKEVDVMLAYSSNEPFVVGEKGYKPVIFNPNEYGFDAYGDILFSSREMIGKDPGTVRNFYYATKRGWEYAFNNVEESVEIIYNKYNTLNKSKEALRYEARELRKLSGIEKNYGELSLERIKSVAQLYSLIMADIYIPARLDDFIYRKMVTSVVLTPAEREYLKQKGTITMCFPVNNPPYTMLSNGQPVGMSVDYLRMMEQKLGIPFDFLYVKDTEEQFKKIENRECDAIPVMLTSPQIVPYVVTSDIVGWDTLALVTRNSEPYVFDLKNLKGKKIGIHNDPPYIRRYLELHYPGLDYVMLDTPDVSRVASGELYGVIGVSAQMGYLVSSDYAHTLKVMTTFEESRVNGSIGVHIDDPVLMNIINKGVLALENIVNERLRHRWINVHYREVRDYTLAYEILLIALLILGGTIYWNRKLGIEIRKRIATEEELRKSEEKFRAIFDLSPVMIDGFDNSGRCILWNKECQKVFGWSIDEINQHQEPILLFYPDKRVAAEVFRSFDDEAQGDFREWHPVDRYGQTRVTRWANVKLYDGSVISIGYDITEQRAMELESARKTQEIIDVKELLKEANDNLRQKVDRTVQEIRNKEVLLEHQSRFAQMGEMMAMIAHQWRQPLSAIAASVFSIQTKLVFRQYDLSEKDEREAFLKKLNDNFEFILGHADAMSETIDDFRNFFRQEGSMEEMSVNDICQKSLQMMRPLMESRGIDTVVDYQSTASVKLYPNKVIQVILNLLKNAQDAFDDKETGDNMIRLSTCDTADEVVIELSDNAGGIPEETASRMFDPYFSTKLDKNGTGLGLYISKMIIEDHHKGTIVYRRVEKGSCFIIRFSKDGTGV